MMVPTKIPKNTPTKYNVHSGVADLRAGRAGGSANLPEAGEDPVEKNVEG